MMFTLCCRTEIRFDALRSYVRASFTMPLQVCDGQSQYSLKVALPAFGGTRGPEIMKSLLELKEAFQKLVNKLRSLSYNLLDVKMTRWHDDFHEYKEHVKDLEVTRFNWLARFCPDKRCYHIWPVAPHGVTHREIAGDDTKCDVHGIPPCCLVGREH